MLSEPNVREWTIRMRLEETDRVVTAIAELVDDHDGRLSVKGVFDTDFADQEPVTARRELAAARALRRLADQLVSSAAQELSISDH